MTSGSQHFPLTHDIHILLPSQPHSYSRSRTVLGSRPILTRVPTSDTGSVGGGGSIDIQKPAPIRSVSSPPRLLTISTQLQKPLFKPESLSDCSPRRRATTSRLDGLISKFESPCDLEPPHSLQGKEGEDVLRPLNLQNLEAHSCCQAQLPQPPSSMSQTSTAMGPSPQQHIPGSSPGRSVATTTTRSPHMSSHDPDVTVSMSSSHGIENKGPVRCADVFYSAARDLGSPKAAKSYRAGIIASSVNRRPG